MVARLAGGEDQTAVVVLAFFAPVAHGVALVVASAAMTARRRSLAIAAGVSCVLGLSWSLTEFRAARPIPAAAAAAPSGARIRLLTQNLRFGNTRVESFADVIASSNADVVVLVELGEQNLEGLSHTGALDRYPFGVVDPRGGGYGIGLYSRLPMDNGEVTDYEGMRLAEAVIELPDGRRIRIIASHVLGARWTGGRSLHRQLRLISDRVSASAEPVIVAGDLNCGWNHAAFRDLLSRGLRDVAVERGRGYSATWPADWPIPPFLRIDHVLVSRDLIPRSVATLSPNGSDHRALVADLILI